MSGPTVLRGMTWEHPRGFDCQAAAAARYREETGVEVHWEYRSLQAFADAPLDALARDHDLLVIDHPHVPLAAEQGLLAPLDGHGHDEELAALAADSLGVCHATYAHGGHQYGLSTDAASQVALWRPDLLAEAPRTWEDVLELAGEGRVLWPGKPIDAFSSLMTLAANHGTPAFAEPGAFLTAEQAAPALEILHRLAERVPDWCLDANPIEVAEALSSAGPDGAAYCPLAYGYTNYGRAGFRRHRLRHVDIPHGPRGVAGSQLGGAGVAVSAFSAHLAEARAYALWVASPEVQSGVYYDAGGQPGYRASWTDARLDADAWGFFSGTRATLEQSWVRPRSAGFVEVQDTASPWVTATLRGQMSDAELVRRTNELAARLLTDTEGVGAA